MRVETLTAKIDCERTGFASSVFVHVDHLEGRIVSLRLSQRWKDGSTLDNLLHAIGDEATALIERVTG